jgi:glycosyltransferase involved in cell wall biosynthesis
VRVCFLTHYFPPEVGAPQTRIELLAQALATQGAEVTVHTGFPHYPSGTIGQPYRNRPWQVESRDGLTVVRSVVYPAANQGFARRLVDHAAFGLSALATAPLSGPVDVVVSETPPLFTAAAGALYARAKRAAHVVHVADRWPASAVALGAVQDARAVAAAHALERSVYRSAELIATPTQGIADELSTVPAAAGKVRRVWPVVDLDRFAVAAETAVSDHNGSPPRPLRLLYAGTVGMAHRLEVLADASRLAGDHVVQTTIAGDGAERARVSAVVRDRQIGNVRLLGPVAAEEVPRLYAETDAAAVLLRDLPIFSGALPTKLFEAMAAGRPLLAAVRGEAARLVTTAGAGLVVAPEDPGALAGAIRDLHADPDLRRSLGQAGRRYAAAHFGVWRATAQWQAVLSEARANRRRPRARLARRSERVAEARSRAD